MHSVQAGLWDPRPPSKRASPSPRPPHPDLRSAGVTAAAPAKRITFYKREDSQFGGIRMAVHKRGFKCFDTLLDDLSQKMPLPFGVRTVTTPRGTHTVQHLEQLQDGGCYLCSDRRQPKPINAELAGKRPNAWYHHSHRPRPPETPPGRSAPRQRRILLVRNGEPGTRRSVALSRRSARSLKTFLDEASEAMQFHVRKLYTAEGRRIDSVQSLMTCPGVLVCVGREAFSPTLGNVVRKSSEEKLPTLGSRSSGLRLRTPGNGARSPATQGARSPPHGSHSRASENSDGQESKKNVNFGLETKKSIIHPRSDSSNRSTHFSMSSEKSYGNSVGAYAQTRPTITNEDIEKRVLVNKDGSLSLEMRVRFRLQNDETLQWSTQVKKSPSLTNESGSLNQAQPYYLQQGQSESCSDRDSASLDPDGVDYSSRPQPQVSEGNHCPCCPQRQHHQYDLWKNPVHSKQSPVPPPHASRRARTITRHTHSSSSSSSCSSRRVVRLSSCGGGSVSERSRLVQEEMCVTERVERRFEVERDGDTHVEVCRVSRCCSRSEAAAVDGDPRPLSRKSVEDEPTMDEAVQRPLSAISSSSHVLQSLKEDQDDDLPFSATERRHGDEPDPSPTTEGNPEGKPTGAVSSSSLHSTETKQEAERGSRAASAASSCRCKTATPHSTAGAERMDRASCGSGRAKIQTSEDEGAADGDEGEITRATSGQTGLSAASLQSRSSSVCPDCGGCKRGVDSAPSSRASQRSRRSHRASPKPATPLPNHDNVNTGGDGDDLANDRCFSAISNVLEGRASNVTPTTAAEDRRVPRATSAASHGSNRSQRSGCNGRIVFSGEKDRSPSAVSAQSSRYRKSATPDIRTRVEAEGGITGDGALSSLSARSGSSSKLSVMAASPAEEDDTSKADRPDSGMSAKSAKSNGSAKSSGSHRSAYSVCVNAAPPADEPVLERTGREGGSQAENRAGSATSAKSNVSAKSNKSHQSTKALERSSSPRPDTEDLEKRARSQTSDRSFKSNGASHTSKSPKNGQSNVTINTPASVDEGGDDGAGMAASSASARSKKSNVSPASSRKSSRSGAAVVETDAGEKVVEDGAAGSECSHGQSQSPVQQLQRRESGGTEQPLSRRSSGSVSLWLPEDQETAESDSGKSNVSRHINSPRVRRASPQNGNPAGSAMSQKSHNNCGKITLSPDPPAVRIPTIETPYRRSGKGDAVRAASALSARSGRSHKSSCKCGVKAEASQTPETGSTTSDSSTEASDVDTPKGRASSAKSSASSRVRSKSPAAGSVQKPAKTKDARNQIPSRASCTAKREGDDKGASPCRLKPESAASARSNPVKGRKVKSRGGVKTSKSEKDDTQLESSHSPRPHSRAETCSQSTLSHSLSAADLLKETMATERPRSSQSKASEGRCEKSQRSRSRADQEEPDLTPACLPNISPSEVVSDWLRRIPTNCGVLGLGDEPREEAAAAGGENGGGAAKTEGRPEDGKVDEEESVEAEEADEEEAACDGAGDAVEAPRPRTWCSSAALMKVLLGPSMGRCQSMPEVSPVYGRRLSTSAQGFLDCLAQLQLLEPAVGPGCGPPKGGQYEDVVAVLQSLWLTEPGDIEARKSKGVGGEQVTPPWSSSGVDMSSGSGGSGKENGNQAGGERERSKTNEAESLREDECGEKLDGQEEEGDAGVENKEVEEDPAVGLEQSEGRHAAPPNLDSPKAPENPSSSDKSSAQDGSKSPTDNERETPEDSSSGTPSTVLQAPGFKRSSQDPDPAWILQLLKKLEKQFMNHYSSAVAEFKVRWDLDDSLVLDAMIAELRDEVSRRVQGSVEREMRKIRGRAGGTGRSAQPPQGRNLSRESTMTEKRRQMLRVMKNQSVKTADSFSDGEGAGDFSDQRSDDEYCPCDACVRKKMAARPPKVNPLAAEAPVMMEFDLLKILQLKKSPSPSAPPPPVEEGGDDVAVDKEARNLEVVQEEEEDETKEDIKADVVLEETIPEEDEEAERGDGGEAGEVGNDEAPEAGGTETGEEEEEETSENVAEEEEEAQCHCRRAKNEEETAKEAAVSEGEKSGEGEEEEEDEEELLTGRECREEECAEGGDEDTGGAESQEEGGEREASGEERASPQGQGATEAEEAEDSDADAGVVESAGVAGDGDEEVNWNKRHDGALLHQVTRTSVESQPGSLEDIDADSSRHPVNAIEVAKMAGGGGGGGGAGQRRSRSPARVKRRKPKACDEELDF